MKHITTAYAVHRTETKIRTDLHETQIKRLTSPNQTLLILQVVTKQTDGGEGLYDRRIFRRTMLLDYSLHQTGN